MIAPSLRVLQRCRFFITLAFAGMLSALAGCSMTTGGHGDPGAQLTGTISGRVLLTSNTGSALALDSGVTVSVIGSSEFSITDTSGRWLLPYLQSGAYTLAFSKSGFGTIRSYANSVTVKDTTQLPTVEMSQPPLDAVGFQDFEIVAPRTLTFVCSMPKIVNRSLVFCLSTDSAQLDANPYESPWTFLASGTGNNYDNSFRATSDSTFSVDTLAHGTVIYATVCVAGEGQNYQSFSHYFDPVAKREVYSALGPHSRMLSVKIP